MPQSPQQKIGSKRYQDAWRAVNVLIRSDGSWSGHERNTCYLNAGDGTFRDVSFVSGLDFSGDGRSFVTLDIDGDGDLDLVLKSRTAPQLRILRNDLEGISDRGRRVLSVELSGGGSNRDAVGARATLETTKRRLTRIVSCGSGYLSQSSRRLHFGLLEGEKPARLEIAWPSGLRQRFPELPETGLIRLVEGQAAVKKIPARRPGRVTPEALPRKPQTPGTWLVEPLWAPDFSLQGLDGQAHRLSAYRGRKVLLNFWATWCPPCRQELADFVANADRFRFASVQLLAVSVDEQDDRERVAEFAVSHGLRFPVLYADDHVVASYTVLNRHLFDRRRDLAIPTSFLLDEEGRIIKVYLGATPASAILADAKAEERLPLTFPGTWYTLPPGRNYLQMATAMAERGLRSEARALFEAAFKAGRTGNELYNNFGGLLLEDGDLDRAEELLRRSLELNPGQFEAQANLGGLLARRGSRAKEAIGFLQEAQKMQPDDAFVHSALGSAHFALGDLGAAEQSYRESVRLEPTSPDHHYNLGSVLATARRYREALRSFQQARKLGSDTVELMNNLGILYMEQGQPDKARAEFERAVQADPSHYGSHLNLALYYVRSGQVEQGQIWIEKAKRLEPQNPAGLLLEAEILI
ncbi:tetratricopeptide repeat protein, partial [Acidobacteria bacterium AH-259-O06]|nr:tetratricopeptide repeat protein [Acidobacteria bacterium AH-259-O06]